MRSWTLLGHRAASCPPIIVDSGQPQESETSCDNSPSRTKVLYITLYSSLITLHIPVQVLLWLKEMNKWETIVHIYTATDQVSLNDPAEGENVCI